MEPINPEKFTEEQILAIFNDRVAKANEKMEEAARKMLESARLSREAKQESDELKQAGTPREWVLANWKRIEEQTKEYLIRFVRAECSKLTPVIQVHPTWIAFDPENPDGEEWLRWEFIKQYVPPAVNEYNSTSNYRYEVVDTIEPSVLKCRFCSKGKHGCVAEYGLIRIELKSRVVEQEEQNMEEEEVPPGSEVTFV